MSQSPQQRDDKGAGAPPKTDAAPPKRTKLKDKKVTVTLTLPQLFFGLFFALFILIWVFIFGVMLGRGHNPEDVMPPLAEMMPERQTPVAIPDEEPVNTIIPPKDLQYHDTLKSRDPAPKPIPTARAAEPQPKPQAAPAKPQPPVKTTPPAPKPVAPAKTGAQKTDQDQTVYNYVYQVAAFNNTAGAQAMQKKLQGDGLSAGITQSESNGTIWYRIMVSFRGTPDDTRALRAKLSAHGISAIILRGKTPAK